MQIFAQNKKIVESLANKDLSVLENMMNDQIDFCINDGQKLVSKKEAIASTLAFLNGLNIKSSRKIHTGDSKAQGTYYEVGKLKTDKGAFRVFIYYENDKVVEFRIDNY